MALVGEVRDRDAPLRLPHRRCRGRCHVRERDCGQAAVPLLSTQRPLDDRCQVVLERPDDRGGHPRQWTPPQSTRSRFRAPEQGISATADLRCVVARGSGASARTGGRVGGEVQLLTVGGVGRPPSSPWGRCPYPPDREGLDTGRAGRRGRAPYDLCVRSRTRGSNSGARHPAAPSYCPRGQDLAANEVGRGRLTGLPGSPDP